MFVQNVWMVKSIAVAMGYVPRADIMLSVDDKITVPDIRNDALLRRNLERLETKISSNNALEGQAHSRKAKFKLVKSILYHKEKWAYLMNEDPVGNDNEIFIQPGVGGKANDAKPRNGMTPAATPAAGGSQGGISVASSRSGSHSRLPTGASRQKPAPTLAPGGQPPVMTAPSGGQTNPSTTSSTAQQPVPPAVRIQQISDALERLQPLGMTQHPRNRWVEIYNQRVAGLHQINSEVNILVTQVNRGGLGQPNGAAFFNTWVVVNAAWRAKFDETETFDQALRANGLKQ